MSVRISAAAQNIEVTSISTDFHSQRMETDDTTKANSFSPCLWWFCEEPINDNVERGIFEMNVGATRAHGFTVQASGGIYTFRWYIASTVVATVAVTESLLNKTVDIFYSFRRDGTTFANSDVQIIVKVRGGGVYASTVNTGVTGIAVGTPTAWVLGGKRHVGASALGTAIVWIRTDVVRDGTNGSTNYAAIIAYDQPHGALLHDLDNPVTKTITAITQTGVPTVTITSAGHGLLAGAVGCKFSGTNSTPAINGLGASSTGKITVVNANTFTFVHSANVTANGTAGTMTVPQIVLSLNHAGGAQLFGAGADGRKGATATNNCLTGMDRGNASFPAYFGRGTVQTLTITGSPACVNPFDYSGQTPRRADRNNSNSTVLSPSDLTYESAAFGTLGLAGRELAAVWNGTAPSRRMRVMVTANSRNGYNPLANVRSRNGTFRGVNAHDGYNESGILEQDNLWPNVVGVWHAAPPSGFPSIVPSMTSSVLETTQTEEATFGFRCNATVGFPVILDNAGAAAGGTPALAMIAGTYRTLDTSVSRFWISSRQAGITGVQGTYFSLGPAAVRGIFAGYSYRIMCSPEHTMPTTDPLVIRLVVINVPSSSTIQRVTRKATASTQNGADTLSAANEPNLPTLGSAFTPLAITAQAGTFTEDSVGEPSTRTTITVDDTGATMAPFVAGDLVELLTNAGVAPTSGYPSQVRPDISTIYSITGKGTSTCVITLDRPFTTTVTAGGGSPSKVSFLDAREMYKTISVRFAAAEVSAGSWRGVEIKASNDGKSGILLASLACENTAVNGITIGNYGWPGIGYRYQRGRMAKVPHGRDGKTGWKRIMELLAPDVVLISQGNQGVGSGTYYTIQRNWYDDLRSMLPAGSEIIHAQGGPEINGDSTADYTPSPATADNHLTMEYTSQLVGCPMLSWYYDPRGVDCLTRYITADDVSQDAVHPRTSKDWEIWGTQLVWLRSQSQGAGSGRLSIGL